MHTSIFSSLYFLIYFISLKKCGLRPIKLFLQPLMWKVLVAQFSSVQSLSCVWLFATPGTVACQAPLSMGFSRQEYWTGLPFPLPGDLPTPRIAPRSPALQVDSLPSEPPGKPMLSIDPMLILLYRSHWHDQDKAASKPTGPLSTCPTFL